jgi:hypothetical protein
MQGLESDKSGLVSKCKDPSTMISLRNYMNFTIDNTARFEGQFKIPKYVKTDMTIF